MSAAGRRRRRLQGASTPPQDERCDRINCFDRTCDRIGSSLREFLELVPVDDASAVQFATVLARTTEDIIDTDHIRSLLPDHWSDYKNRPVTFPAHWCQYRRDDAVAAASTSPPHRPLAHFRCLRALVKLVVYSTAEVMGLTNRSSTTTGRRGRQHPPNEHPPRRCRCRTSSHTDRENIAFSLWALYRYTVVWLEEIGNPVNA